MNAFFRTIRSRCEVALDAYWEQLTVGQSSYLDISIERHSEVSDAEAPLIAFERSREPAAGAESRSA